MCEHDECMGALRKFYNDADLKLRCMPFIGIRGSRSTPIDFQIVKRYEVEMLIGKITGKRVITRKKINAKHGTILGSTMFSSVSFLIDHYGIDPLKARQLQVQNKKKTKRSTKNLTAKL